MTVRRHGGVRARAGARGVATVGLAAILLAACGPAASVTASPGAGSASPGTRSSPGPTPATPASTSATPSPVLASPAPASPEPVPGFEGWRIFNPTSVDASADGDALVLRLTRRALWFQAQHGVLVWMPVTGDFRVTATVALSRTSDPSGAIDDDGVVRLGGLMARADGTRENYVFVVVGADRDGLSVETKSTTNNASRFDGPAWPAAAATLRLCRSGSTFTMLKRAAGSSDAWSIAATIDRADLPGQLQVGPNLYSDGPPDVTARFEDLRLEPLAADSDCAA